MGLSWLAWRHASMLNWWMWGDFQRAMMLGSRCLRRYTRGVWSGDPWCWNGPDSGTEGHRAEVKSSLSKYTAKGERVLAVQYAQVMRQQDWLHLSAPMLKHRDFQVIVPYIDIRMNVTGKWDRGVRWREAWRWCIGGRCRVGDPWTNDYNDDILLADL